jgi:hypothetical protein
MKKINIVIYFLFNAICFSGCGIYSFTGASISPDLKTISIENLLNNSAGPPYMSQVFTEKLRGIYQQNTSLSLIEGEADLNLRGRITGYSVAPIAIQSNDQAAQTRLTITLQVEFINSKDEKQNFNTPFTFYADFDQSRSISQVENGLINDIADQIVLDIFNKSVANW